MKKNDLEHYFHNRNIRQLIHYIKEAHLLKSFEYELLRQQKIINIYPEESNIPRPSSGTYILAI